jgi:hypothetical protein
VAWRGLSIERARGRTSQTAGYIAGLTAWSNYFRLPTKDGAALARRAARILSGRLIDPSDPAKTYPGHQFRLKGHAAAAGPSGSARVDEPKYLRQYVVERRRRLDLVVCDPAQSRFDGGQVIEHPGQLGR